MLHSENLLTKTKPLLGPSGVLVVNAHIDFDSLDLLPFVKVFDSVNAVFFHKLKQAAVVCSLSKECHVDLTVTSLRAAMSVENCGTDFDFDEDSVSCSKKTTIIDPTDERKYVFRVWNR
jgi:hypothetical protein